jgi:hypothetical protein
LPVQTEGEVLQPIGQIQILPAHALNRLVVAGSVAIIVLTESKQALEIVALAIEAIDTRMPMIAMTIINSISVNPRGLLRFTSCPPAY